MRPPATKGNKKRDKLRDKLGDNGDKTSGRRTHHPTQGNKKGDNGRLRGRQNRGKVDAPSNTGTHVGTMGDKGRQDLAKGDTPSNTGTHVGRQKETRPREGGHNIQHGHTCGDTIRDKGRQGLLKADMIQGGDTIQHRHQCGETRGDTTSGRRTHHPTQADKGRQDRGKVDHPTQAHMWGDNGRQWAQWERRGDKTSGTPSNTGTHVGRQ